MPVEVGSLESLKVGDQKDALRTYFADLGFTRLLARLDAPENGTIGTKKTAKSTKGPINQIALF